MKEIGEQTYHPKRIMVQAKCIHIENEYYVYRYAYTQIYTDKSCIHAILCMHTVHTHTSAHARTHTHMHTYTHTDTRIYTQSLIL